jgi:hypothetical protein
MADPSPAARPTLWIVRAVVSVHLAAALAQPVLAGIYLTGDLDAIVAHAAVAGVVLLVDVVLLAVTVVHAVAGRGPWWLPAVVLGFVVAVVTQIALGAARALGGHVPLGVAIVAASVVLALWAWGPGSRRGRPHHTIAQSPGPAPVSLPVRVSGPDSGRSPR